MVVPSQSWDLHFSAGHFHAGKFISQQSALVTALAALSPWDSQKPAEERSLHIVDLERYLVDTLQATPEEARAVSELLGFRIHERQQQPVVALTSHLKRLCEAASLLQDRGPSDSAGQSGAVASHATSSDRLAAALSEVRQLRASPASPGASDRAEQLALFGVDLTLPVFSNEDGETLLMLGAACGWLGLCRHLCACVALRTSGHHALALQDYLDAQGWETGFTALLYAARGQHIHVASFLLDVKASPNLTSRLAGLSPLMIAADMGDLELCQVLLGKRADATQKDRSAKSCFDYAAQHVDREPSSIQQYRQVLQLVDDAWRRHMTPASALRNKDAATHRRRRRQVTYAAGSAVGIQWRMRDEKASEVLVWAIEEADPAYQAGVRAGWGLLAVDGAPSLTLEDARLSGILDRMQYRLEASVLLEFGRPTVFPDDLQASIVARKNRRV